MSSTTMPTSMLKMTKNLRKSQSGLRALTISASKSRTCLLYSLTIGHAHSLSPRDAAVIKGYPRNLPSVVRREDTSRKEARERRKRRKEEELAKKREEVKRLKGLKMKDLRAKLERIGREGGKNIDETKGGPLLNNATSFLMLPVVRLCTIALQDLDLEGDWDPESHDQQMADLYGNDDPYVDDKPQWDDDIDIGDIMSDTTEDQVMSNKKKKKKKKDKAPVEEDEGVDVDAMDADVQRGTDEEEWDGTEEMRKRKLDEYMDEIYGLDFNDMVSTPVCFCCEEQMQIFHRSETCPLDSSTLPCNLSRLR
jgi:protein KRI1